MKEHLSLPDEAITSFFGQLKRLSFEEKMQFHKMLAHAGIHCEFPKANVEAA